MDFWGSQSQNQSYHPDPYQEAGIYDHLKNNVSYVEPDAIDQKASQSLEQYLRKQNVYETPEGETHRKVALFRLEAICTRWVQDICKQEGYNMGVVRQASVLFFPFGSYRMGVHGPGTDIDLLAIGPGYTNKDIHVFGTDDWCLEKILKEHIDVSDLVSIPEAIVPVIKFKFKGISFDFVYVPLITIYVPEDLDLTDVAIIRNVLPDAVPSINGRRVTDRLMDIVPDFEVFKTALRFLKLWAKNRAIYGNVMGYLGGINISLLLAFTQMLFPCCNASMLIFKFFKIFAHWQWPTPVLLEPLLYESIGLPIWDPRMNPTERNQIMPIITPVYPAFNSSYSVTENTLAIIQEEFKRATNLCNSLFKKSEIKNENEEDIVKKWDKVIEPFEFFETFPNFLQIEIRAGDELDLLAWSGWIQSRLRKLVYNLSCIAEVRLLPKDMSLRAEKMAEKFKKELEEKQESLKNRDINIEEEHKFNNESERKEENEISESERQEETKEEEKEFIPLEAIYWIGVLRPHTYPTRSRNGSPLLEMGRPIKEFKYTVYKHYQHYKPGMEINIKQFKQDNLSDDIKKKMKSARYSELQRKNEKDKMAEEIKTKLPDNTSLSTKDMTIQKSDIQQSSGKKEKKGIFDVTLDDFQEIFESAKNKIDEVLKSSSINTNTSQEVNDIDKVPSSSKRSRDEEILPTVEEISGYLVDEESNITDNDRHFMEKDDRRKALKIIWSKDKE